MGFLSRLVLIASVLCLGAARGAGKRTTITRQLGPFARAKLQPKSGSQVTGAVEIARIEEGLQITATLVGAKAGNHGIHIHEKGDCGAEDASSAGGHFNPGHSRHGGSNSLLRHRGDLGNVLVTEDGRGTLVLTLPKTGDKKVDEGLDFIGKAVVVHASEDDLKSQPAGASGGRIACGVIDRLPILGAR